MCEAAAPLPHDLDLSRQIIRQQADTRFAYLKDALERLRTNPVDRLAKAGVSKGDTFAEMRGKSRLCAHKAPPSKRTSVFAEVQACVN